MKLAIDQLERRLDNAEQGSRASNFRGRNFPSRRGRFLSTGRGTFNPTQPQLNQTDGHQKQRCFRCGKVGHYIYTCRSSSGSHGNAFGSRPSRNSRRSFRGSRRFQAGRRGYSAPTRYQTLAIDVEAPPRAFRNGEVESELPLESPPEKEVVELKTEVAALHDQLEHLATQPYSALVASVLCEPLQVVEKEKVKKNYLVPQVVFASI